MNQAKDSPAMNPGWMFNDKLDTKPFLLLKAWKRLHPTTIWLVLRKGLFHKIVLALSIEKKKKKVHKYDVVCESSK